jgi:hypothetical protein
LLNGCIFIARVADGLAAFVRKHNEPSVQRPRSVGQNRGRWESAVTHSILSESGSGAQCSPNTSRAAKAGQLRKWCATARVWLEQTGWRERQLAAVRDRLACEVHAC